MIVVDIETAGQYMYRHSILSIGAVDMSNPKNTFYRECNMFEGTEIDPHALEINGFKEDDINSNKKSSLKEILNEFLDYINKIGERDIVGYNVTFDQYFLNYYLDMCGLGSFILGIRTIDLHTLIYANMLQRKVEIPLMNGRSGISADIALNYVGLPSEPKPHNGLTGAKMEAEMASRVLYGKNLLEEYAQFEIPAYLRK